MDVNDSGFLAVRCVSADGFFDRLYGSGLRFEPQQTRMVPQALAGRLLAHGDVFVADRAAAAPKAARAKDDDGTQAQLERAAQQEAQQQRNTHEHYSLLAQIERMDKESAQNFGRDHFNVTIPKTLSVENMRQRLSELVERFGAPQ